MISFRGNNVIYQLCTHFCQVRQQHMFSILLRSGKQRCPLWMEPQQLYTSSPVEQQRSEAAVTRRSGAYLLECICPLLPSCMAFISALFSFVYTIDRVADGARQLKGLQLFSHSGGLPVWAPTPFLCPANY